MVRRESLQRASCGRSYHDLPFRAVAPELSASIWPRYAAAPALLPFRLR